MKSRKPFANEYVLNLMSHRAVAWTFIKLSTVYKYVGLFV